jgi:hypothetical protein
VGTKSNRLVTASSDLAAAIGGFLEIVDAFDQAIKFANNPLQYLARFLIKRIRIKQEEQLPVPPEIKPPKISFP